MSSANEFLFSSRFSSSGEVSGLVSAFAYGTVPTDFAVSSMPPVTRSGLSSGGTLPLHAGMVGAAGISSVMLRAVPGRAVPCRALLLGPCSSEAPLLPRGGELLLAPSPRGLVLCVSGPGASPPPSPWPHHPLCPGLASPISTSLVAEALPVA